MLMYKCPRNHQTSWKFNVLYCIWFYYILFLMFYVKLFARSWYGTLQSVPSFSQEILAETYWGMEFSVCFFSPVSPFKKMSKVNLLYIYLCRTCSGCLRSNQERRKQSEKSGKVKWWSILQRFIVSDVFFALSFRVSQSSHEKGGDFSAWFTWLNRGYIPWFPPFKDF